MKKETVKISIIVPIYNIQEAYLRQCVDSLICQTLRNIEIILIDDGSADNSAKICDQYGKMDDRVIVIHQQNQGVSVARNAGMEAAHGTYLMFVDPDDWITPDCCERVFNIASEVQCDLVFFQHEERNENGNLFRSFPPIGSLELNKSDIRKIQADGLADYGESFGFQSMSPWGKLYRRSFISRHHFRFPAGIARRQDQLFNLNCLEHLERAFFYDYVGYYYRRNSSSALNRYKPELLNMLLSFLHEAESFVNQYHAGEIAFERLLGALSVNMLNDLEDTFYFPAQRLISFRDFLKYAKQYYSDPTVKKFLKKCRLSDMRQPKQKARFICYSGHLLFVYYCYLIYKERIKYGAGRAQTQA